ncbi:MAG TPA: hypothetical protein VMS54_04960, partial [Vicinamibacterales bacterium]|nr:hypothetical protein [Vicinamibacterales bacterium]
MTRSWPRSRATAALAAGIVALAVAGTLVTSAQTPARTAQTPSRADVLSAMKRATMFMVDTVSTNGG